MVSRGFYAITVYVPAQLMPAIRRAATKKKCSVSRLARMVLIDTFSQRKEAK